MPTINRALSTFFTVAALFAFGVSASATESSRLACLTNQVEINEPVVCNIYVRDTLQEPTVMFNPNDFSVRVVAEDPTAVPVVSALTLTEDPTVVQFTVVTAIGTNIRIDVVVKSVGALIRESGFIASVLVWPATMLGPITCDKSILTLRTTATCSADLTGPKGVPATLHTTDVVFSEVNSAGSVKYVSGVRKLVFKYTAPAALSAASSFANSFTVEVSLPVAKREFSVALPLAYPTTVAPDSNSILTCDDGATMNKTSLKMCTIMAKDAFGPVAFDKTFFAIVFERLMDGLWVDITYTMDVKYVAGPNAAITNITFIQKEDKEVFASRMSVISQGKNVLGSPLQYHVGVRPSWKQFTFRSCATNYLVRGNSTKCTIDVSSGYTADPAFISVGSSLGGVFEGPYFEAESYRTSPTDDVPKTRNTLVFVFTPPPVASLTNAQLYVTSGNVNIVASPFTVKVSPESTMPPKTNGNNNDNDEENNGSSRVFIVLLFFVFVAATAAIAFFKRDEVLEGIVKMQKTVGDKMSGKKAEPQSVA